MGSRGGALCILLVVLAAGCVAPRPGAAGEGATPDAGRGLAPEVLRFHPPVRAMEECAAACFEPTLAAGPDGSLLFVPARGGAAAVSRDGGASFAALSLPPLPEGVAGLTRRADALFQFAPDGALFFHALVRVDVPGSVVIPGIQVARSDDAGASWASNVLLGPAHGAGAADRQWMALAAAGSGHLAFAQGVAAGPGVWVARTDDGAKTFAQPVLAAPAYGGVAPTARPIVRLDERALLLPLWRGFAPAAPGEEPSTHVAVARSADAGGSFEESVLYVAAGPGAGDAPTYFPAVAVDGARVHVAWSDLSGVVRWAVSSDAGASWTEPVALDLPGGATESSPWLAPRPGGGVDLVRFARGQPGDAVDVWVHRFGRGAGLDEGPSASAQVASGVEAASALAPANTDFAHAVHLADGRLAVVWTDGADALPWVAVEAARGG